MQSFRTNCSDGDRFLEQVAERCRERLHHLVSEELTMGENASSEWRGAMERSFDRMDKEVTTYNEDASGDCRCELRSPHRDAVGSTAVVAVVSPKKIVVANCGDSRVVLSRDGKAVPLSSDHKPDRPIELNQIQEAGGQVTYLDQPRVLDVLAMSRAIGDNYLKPYVSSEPEVTVTERVAGDECLILASDGLWDVVTNDIACNVARTCLSSNAPLPSSVPLQSGESSDKGCSDASMLLTKLALARHTADNLSIVVVDLRNCT
ncbi:hypothetical protein Droror1_Dr00003260 [Drosera rotundifolia]